MKNVKLWIYHSLAYGYSKKTAKKFKVLDADFKLKKYVDANTRLSLYVMLEKGYTPKTLFEFDRIVDLNCESLTSWTGRFVGKKMAFIIRSQKIPATDLIAQLLSCGYASILHNYPKIESTEHLINLMKSQIRNRGINLIEFYATAKRSNLNREENGEFAAKIVSLDTTFVSKEVGSMAAEENQDAEILRLTIRRLISKYNGKRQIFIYLLMGYYHKDFSVYLKTVGINVPNDVYFDRLKDMDLYIRHALDYLGVAHSVGFKFVEKIKTALAA